MYAESALVSQEDVCDVLVRCLDRIALFWGALLSKRSI